MGAKTGMIGRMSGDAGAFPECQLKTVKPDHIAVQVLSSGLGRVGIGWSSGDGLNMGRHEKAPVRCPCSWLAAVYGAPWMYHLMLLTATVVMVVEYSFLLSSLWCHLTINIITVMT